MNAPKLLVLLRHGESIMNLDEVMDGRFVREGTAHSLAGLSDLEIPLTGRGELQAFGAGRGLRKSFDFDVVYQSDHIRSIRTADNVLIPYRDGPMAPERRQTFLLNERNNGYTFGMTYPEAKASFPWLEDYWERWGWFLATPPGGESVATMTMLRTIPFLSRLNEEATGKRVLVVGHGRWIQSARVQLEGLPTDTKECPLRNADNCGWVAYAHDEATGHLKLLDDSHYRPE